MIVESSLACDVDASGLKLPAKSVASADREVSYEVHG